MSITTQLEPPNLGNGEQSLQSKQSCSRLGGAMIAMVKRWKSLAKEWKSLALVCGATIMLLVLNNPIYNAFYFLALASIFYLLLLRKLEPIIGQQKWTIPPFHALLASIWADPVLAQATGITDNANACTSNGLFANVTNFVTTLFSSITFGGVGGGSLSNLICQVIGFVTVSLILGFVGILATVAYQVGYQQQPVSVVVNPLFGFLIFAGGVTVVVGVMIGVGTTGVT